MIQIAGTPFQQKDMWSAGRIESIIIQSMRESPDIYSYDSMNELLFEINLRKNIILSGKALIQSEAAFETFDQSKANPQYWYVTEEGGFQLKQEVKPSEAIRDIFKNSFLYAFECATATIIIYYDAVLNTIGERLFNQFFQNLYLYSWHADYDLGIQTIDTDYFLPGDVVYFNNPDFPPTAPWWRGENAILLEDGSFLGHGVGIKKAEQMIQFLNEMRKPNSTQSAYLINNVVRPSFQYLSHLPMLQRTCPTYKVQYVVIHHNECSISYMQYLYYLKGFYE
ncbi:MAG: protein-glutamine gamma-glutamyltransferase [Bacillus sp. (in: firmicutes)]